MVRIEQEDELMHKLIVKKCPVACALANFVAAHYFEHYFLNKIITPKHLKLAAGGGLLGGFFNSLLEGYRTPLPTKITQPIQKQKPIKQGGANKGEV